MVINWFTENYPPNMGGMSRSCDRIVNNLREHHTVNVFHFSIKSSAFYVEAQVGGSYISLPIFMDSAHTLNVLWTFLKDNQIAKEGDVFVSFGNHLTIKGMPLIAQWLKKPLVTCFRGNDFDTSIFSNKRNDVLYAIQNSADIACVSTEKVERVIALDLNVRVTFTPNSIHLEEWEILDSDREFSDKIKKQLLIKDGATVIGLIGFMKEKKGIEFFISCIKKTKYFESIHFRFVGEPDERLEQFLILNEIDFSKTVPESKTELIANYLLCDLIAIPSIYDGMPNVMFEAAALGIPIIASNAGGIPDVLDDRNAFVFDALLEGSLIDSFTRFKNSTNEELIAQTKNLKEKIKNEFSPKHEIKNYLKIFEKIK